MSDPQDTPRASQFVDADTLIRERLPRMIAATLWMGLVLGVGFLAILEFDPPATTTFVAGVFASVGLIEPVVERVKTW